MAFAVVAPAVPVTVTSGSLGISYQGQDLFVVQLLDGLRGGFFLDSGASDGRRGSNSLLLERDFGWTGICVEPNAELFAELVRHRTCVCLDCCLWDRDEPVEFLEQARVYGGIMSAYEPDHLRFAAASIGADAAAPPTVEKRARSIRSVLVEHAAPPVIDYWSLDTEGSELAILRAFPYDEFTVRVLTVEHNERMATRRAIAEVLTPHGYRFVRRLGIDDCWVHGDLVPPTSPALAARGGGAWRSAAWSRR